ncbi:uncharacterized protein EI90DRAFT_3137214 [Cantharellus anzutake]|uniref:uncharacterized protein n=1 Tax=Cantharellus anzutake TaxID=1750568 RepID=UPI0019067BF4|nr:uncharacterized protein EI90DRAFT_3137214 [Cantharellus anzutake]KAF8312598.1 hypothetical protein EI90DRAFT_3137214 [Cantharellus anzutake]
MTPEVKRVEVRKSGRGRVCTDMTEAPGKAPGYESHVKQTIFQLKPTLLIVDEIHNHQKHPVKMYPLCDAATFMMGHSGTPLVMEPQDLLNIGLMLGVPDMMTLNVTSSQNDARQTIQKLTANSNSNSREMLSNAILSGNFIQLSQNSDLQIAHSLMRDSILSFKQNFNGYIL